MGNGIHNNEPIFWKIEPIISVNEPIIDFSSQILKKMSQLLDMMSQFQKSQNYRIQSVMIFFEESKRAEFP